MDVDAKIAELLQRRGCTIYRTEDRDGKLRWHADVFVDGPRIRISGKGDTLVEAIQAALLQE